MKKYYFIKVFLVLLLLFSIDTNSARGQDGANSWMVGGEMATVWTWTSIFGGPQRDLCCVESDIDNACNLNSQSDIQLCRSGRDNDAFIFVFENEK